MDTYRDHPSDFDSQSDSEHASVDVSEQIGTDERRMHVRAYNYWVSLLDGRDFPSIEDLEPGDVEDFAGNSVLLDFTCGRDNPAIPYVGADIREECALHEGVRTISDVPSRSLLSRLTDHFMQIIANRAPVGFEAEFDNPRGETICYRGILMPFSSDGDTIDFIYGVINWKHVNAASTFPTSTDVDVFSSDEMVARDDSSDDSSNSEPVAAQEGPLELTEIFEPAVVHGIEAPVEFEPQPLDGDDPLGAAQEHESTPVEAALSVQIGWDDGSAADLDYDAVIELDESAGLADRLWAARESAESVRAGEGRTRTALYKALSLAYDFAISAEQNPNDYAELLEESGMKAQARAPMTPVVKLVFGIDYDKARLTEFSAALSNAHRQKISFGGFMDFIEKTPGGLKALVAAERLARRPQHKPDTKTEAARARLRSAPSISLSDVPSDDEFAVIITRRSASGSHEPVAILEDEALVERAIRRAA